jgi:hypothetical protein
MTELRKEHLKMFFHDNRVYQYIALWLKPLPDKSLPNIKASRAWGQREGRHLLS